MASIGARFSGFQFPCLNALVSPHTIAGHLQLLPLSAYKSDDKSARVDGVFLAAPHSGTMQLPIVEQGIDYVETWGSLQFGILIGGRLVGAVELAYEVCYFDEMVRPEFIRQWGSRWNLQYK
jgi:hypothetical protein